VGYLFYFSIALIVIILISNEKIYLSCGIVTTTTPICACSELAVGGSGGVDARPAAVTDRPDADAELRQ